MDSGDLAYLSVETRKFFRAIEKEFGVFGFGDMTITASNDINEETLDALNKQVVISLNHLMSKFSVTVHYIPSSVPQCAISYSPMTTDKGTNPGGLVHRLRSTTGSSSMEPYHLYQWSAYNVLGGTWTKTRCQHMHALWTRVVGKILLIPTLTL